MAGTCSSIQGMAAGRPLTNTTTTGVPVPWTASTSSSCAPGSRNRGAKVGFGTLEYIAALGVMNLTWGCSRSPSFLSSTIDLRAISRASSLGHEAMPFLPHTPMALL